MFARVAGRLRGIPCEPRSCVQLYTIGGAGNPGQPRTPLDGEISVSCEKVKNSSPAGMKKCRDRHPRPRGDREGKVRGATGFAPRAATSPCVEESKPHDAAPSWMARRGGIGPPARRARPASRSGAAGRRSARGFPNPVKCSLHALFRSWVRPSPVRPSVNAQKP